jgi:hypothetical protein
LIKDFYYIQYAKEPVQTTKILLIIGIRDIKLNKSTLSKNGKNDCDDKDLKYSKNKKRYNYNYNHKRSI